MINKIKLGFLLVTILCLAACQEPQETEPSVYVCQQSIEDLSNTHPNAAALQAELDRITELAPGIVASVQNPEGLMWSGASGMADIPSAVTMAPCHKLMVGSVSKIFTGVLIMQLQEEGILSLEDPLSDWLDQELIADIANANEVNIQQLLNHTTGIKDYLSVGYHVDALNIPNYKLTQREKLELLHGKNAEFDPGEKHSYSNSNYVLLGLVIEAARSMPLWDVTEKYITSPLELFNCVMGTHENPIPSGTARPYLHSGNGKFYDMYQNSVSDGATGDGGIASSMQDLILFFNALRKGILVKDETYQLMQDLKVSLGDGADDEFYGLGLELSESNDNGPVIGHMGSTSSYTSFLFYLPDLDGTIALSMNGRKDSNELNGLIGEVIGNLVDLGIK